MIERMLQLPEGVHVHSVNDDWATDSIEVMLEGDSLPTYAELVPGVVPMSLGFTVTYTDDGKIEVKW
jgi:hypothetical protein